jgi:uncharacterized repeat protein (TIGR03803 family)
MNDKRVWLVSVWMLAVVASILLSPTLAFAGTGKMLYGFHEKGTNDGALPYSGVVFDAEGNLYGTTESGGTGNGYGTVFELSPNGDGTWSEKTLYSFQGSPDGEMPLAGLVMDGSGNLYGTTSIGGVGGGTIFELSPNSDGTWTETILHSFTGGSSDGAGSEAGLIFDASGDLYTTTVGGGAQESGTVFELSPSNGSWTGKVLYSFCSRTNCADGSSPISGLTFDSNGNLYGATLLGGTNNVKSCQRHACGTIFELSPNTGGNWTESVLHSFNGQNGKQPVGSLVFDLAGNLYGVASLGGGTHNSGTVFKLGPSGQGWRMSTLYRFPIAKGGSTELPDSGVIFDAAGNLYGETASGGAHWDGTVFKLTPAKGGKWGETDLFTFDGGDGEGPVGGLVSDTAGNLYGTTIQGGPGDGTVFEVTP